MNLSFYHWFHLGESRIYPLYHLDETRHSFLVSLRWTFFVMSCLIFVIPSTRLLMGFYWDFFLLCFIFMSPFYSASFLPLKDCIGLLAFMYHLYESFYWNLFYHHRLLWFSLYHLDEAITPLQSLLCLTFMAWLLRVSLGNIGGCWFILGLVSALWGIR